MNRDELKSRTYGFALRIVKLVRAMPHTLESQVIGKQVLRSGTSVAANYRATCRARSKAEFTAKMGVVVEEIDETSFWLELIGDSNLLPTSRIAELQKESKELLAIFTRSYLTLKGISPRNR